MVDYLLGVVDNRQYLPVSAMKSAWALVLWAALIGASFMGALAIRDIDGPSHIVQPEPAGDFETFTATFGKTYLSAEEREYRNSVFLANSRMIEEHNARGTSGYTLAVNQFADLTWEEFSQHMLGAEGQDCSATGNEPAEISLEELPEHRDWRKKGIVSPVKNQAHCGSCWTFSTTGALEAAYAQLTGKIVSLSEQQLVDCAGDFNNHGCSGGLPSQAFEYIKYAGGLELESDYEYEAKDDVCRFNRSAAKVRVKDVVNITQGNEHQLMRAVGLVRPVSVAFDVVQDFRFYKEGVYSSADCGNQSSTVNHAVLAVGYGVTEDKVPYWIIKNSWGDQWGMEGYFQMEMGRNMCGIAMCASYPVLHKKGGHGDDAAMDPTYEAGTLD
eukprot:jgi/Mesvir1/25095/Mv21559-RA.1